MAREIATLFHHATTRRGVCRCPSSRVAAVDDGGGSLLPWTKLNSPPRLGARCRIHGRATLCAKGSGECRNHAEAIAKPARSARESALLRSAQLGTPGGTTRSSAARAKEVQRHRTCALSVDAAPTAWLSLRRHAEVFRRLAAFRVGCDLPPFNEPASAVSPWLRSVRDTRQNMSALGQSVARHGARNRICCCAASLLSVLLFPLSALTLLRSGEKQPRDLLESVPVIRPLHPSDPNARREQSHRTQ
jgi:hypothetical protein